MKTGCAQGLISFLPFYILMFFIFSFPFPGTVIGVPLVLLGRAIPSRMGESVVDVVPVQTYGNPPKRSKLE